MAIYPTLEQATPVADFYAKAFKDYLTVSPDCKARLEEMKLVVTSANSMVRVRREGMVDRYVAFIPKSVKRRNRGNGYWWKVKIVYTKSQQWVPKDNENPSHCFMEAADALLKAAEEQLVASTESDWDHFMVEAAQAELMKVYPSDQHLPGLDFDVWGALTLSPGAIRVRIGRSLTIEQVQQLIALVRRWPDGKT